LAVAARTGNVVSCRQPLAHLFNNVESPLLHACKYTCRPTAVVGVKA